MWVTKSSSSGANAERERKKSPEPLEVGICEHSHSRAKERETHSVRNFNFCFSHSLLTREERRRRPFFPNKGAKVSHKKSHQLLFCRYTYDEQYHLVRSKEGTTTTTTREQLYRERAAFSSCRVHNRGRRKERPFTNKTDRKEKKREIKNHHVGLIRRVR